MWKRAVGAVAGALVILTVTSTAAAQGVRLGAGVGPTISLESGGGH